jgi:F-type H+-transporting ATPase subunit b
MGETIQALGISWPKLIGQIVNFGIVLFVLWRWAYRPVLALLEERRQKISESMENADRIKAELAKTEATRQETMNQAHAQANQFITEARAAAARILEQETQKAVAAAEQIVTKAREATEQDHARMLAELKREIGRLVVETTAKVSGKVLTKEDQQRLMAETTKELAA